MSTGEVAGTRKRVLILVTLGIVLLDSLLIWLNYNASRTVLEDNLATQGQESREAFALSLDQTATTMQQVATFAASDLTTQGLFRAGRDAVLVEEGGTPGPGGKKAAQARKDLYENIESSWSILTGNYDIRQLHFHLGPQDVSFLRVHKPEKFGDNLSSVRHSIVAANEFGEPTKGFESGRVKSGIRGVVPVVTTDPKTGKQEQIGALEAGTSFQTTLTALEQALGNQFAVTMAMAHAEETLWPEQLGEFLDDHIHTDQFVVESSTSPDVEELLAIPEVQALASAPGTTLVEVGGEPLAVTGFPLRDFAGNQDPSRPDVGLVLSWRSAADEVGDFWRTVWLNVLFALLALVVVEAVLIFSWRYGTARLNRTVDSRTQELSSANTSLSDEIVEHKKTQVELAKQAATDSLTGAANRRAFFAGAGTFVSRFGRSGEPFSLVVFDLDLFKRINDGYGHQMGDRVLVAVATACALDLREHDLIARIGGEEFAVLLADADGDLAMQIAERLRARVAQSSIMSKDGAEVSFTISVGVAQFRSHGENIDELMSRADAAMYAAKAQGRNRVVRAKP